MKINFIGDLIFGDQPIKFGYGFDSIHKSNGYNGIFDDVKSIFKDGDFTIANFETVIKPRPASENISNWSMCCDLRIIKVLQDAGINILNMANNHTMDYGYDYFQTTVNLLQNDDFSIIGLKDKPYIILENHNKTEKIAIIGVSFLKAKTDKLPYFCNPTDDEWNCLINELNTHKTTKKLLFAHWGNEFVYKPTNKQLEIIDKISKYNFDGIIGHHPHIIQTEHLHNNTPVFYSIGNFVSDYWQQEARKTIVLRYDLNVKVNWQKIDCKINDMGIPKVTSNFTDVEFKEYDGEKATLYEIKKARNKLRKEYVIEFITNYNKIRNKRFFRKWLYKRIIYLIKYGRKELSNPDIIYEKYQH